MLLVGGEMESIKGNGALALNAGFFTEATKSAPAGKWSSVAVAGKRVKLPEEHQKAVRKALEGKYIHDGIRSYAKQKSFAVFDPHLAFDKHLDDYSVVMRFLAKEEKHGRQDDDTLGIAERLRECRLYRLCQMRCCPICRMESILRRLDEVARVLDAHQDRTVIRFVTFLDEFTYAEDVLQEWGRS